MKKIFLSIAVGIILVFNIQGQNFIQVNKSNTGQTVQINQDQVLEISLPRKSSTGYIWCESSSTNDKSTLQSITQIGNVDFIHDTSSGTFINGKTIVGQSGNQIIRYVGASQGTTVLTLELRRPWEKNKPAVDNFTITVASGGKYTGTYTPPLKSTPSLLTSTPLDLPSKFDWRSQCTPIEDQEQCGSCWAFAGVGTLECNILIHDGVIRDISEQYLINCATDIGNGCQGGQCPHKYWLAPGCVYASDLPYVDGGCNLTDQSAACVGTCGTYTHHEAIDSYANVAGENSSGIPADSSIKRAIYNYGPIWIAVDASSSGWQNYTGGIFTEISSTGHTDHAVVLVGWVDSTAVSGGGYWILRNSWGPNWGDKGYMYITYGSDLVGTDANYIVYKGGAPHITPPIANFIASSTSSCTGTIQFTDATANSPISWIWDFGDSTTSTLQNPSHTYTASGTYTVSLIATNSYGNNTVTRTSYIAINLLPSPTTIGATTTTGGSDTLHASGSGTLNWYDAAIGGNLVYTGTIYILSPISTTKTYYVENDNGNSQPTQASVGMTANTTNGSYYTSTARQGLVFNAIIPITIKSVTVYANSTASRTIFLQNSSGTVIDSLVTNITSGTQTVTLNFNVPTGTGYTLGCSSNNSLWRESSGAVYPYTLSGVVSITGNTAGAGNTGRYYYFYNWQVQYTTTTSCASARVPVTATVYSPIPAVSSPATNAICSGMAQNYTITSTDTATTYTWSRAAVAGISNTAVANQTGSTISEILTNTTTAPVNVTYLITPTANGYTGSTFTYTVTVNPIPSVTSSATGSVCSGVPQNYIITSTIPSSIYTWTSVADTGTGNTGVTVQANPITEVLNNTSSQPVNVTYQITPIANGCSGDVFTYTVSVNPIPTVLNSTTGWVCSGVAENLTLISQVAGTTFNWSRAAVIGISDTAKINQTNNPITETLHNSTALPIYVIYLITPFANTCTGAQFSYLLTVDDMPANAGTISGKDTVCQNGTYTYTVPYINSATSYAWTFPNITTKDTSYTNSITVTYSSSAQNGNITVKGIDVCGIGATSSPLAIIVDPAPQAPTITLDGVGTLLSSSNNGNQWYNQDSLITGATNQTYSYTTIGNYYDIVTANGCSSLPSDTVSITDAVINVNKINETINVYPNPVSNELILESKGINENIIFEIYNSIGEIVYKGNLIGKTVVQTTNFAQGIYLIRLDNGKSFEFKKILKD